MTVCSRAVLGGLIEFCEEVKNAHRPYGMVQDRQSSGKATKRIDAYDFSNDMSVPDNLMEELKRIRSMNGDPSRLGYDPMLIKLYKHEMKLKKDHLIIKV
ncbi:MAG: hypothetical protein P9M13_04490 [Candidatus Ancaeobacter aquaticus]|nr:hypothetical protein [Candidatus Ancaeobacter aquaticus]